MKKKSREILMGEEDLGMERIEKSMKEYEKDE